MMPIVAFPLSSKQQNKVSPVTSAHAWFRIRGWWFGLAIALPLFFVLSAALMAVFPFFVFEGVRYGVG
jgi:hypothetical protein